jgi:hypothetical protein
MSSCPTCYQLLPASLLQPINTESPKDYGADVLVLRNRDKYSEKAIKINCVIREIQERIKSPDFQADTQQYLQKWEILIKQFKMKRVKLSREYVEDETDDHGESKAKPRRIRFSPEPGAYQFFVSNPLHFSEGVINLAALEEGIALLSDKAARYRKIAQCFDNIRLIAEYRENPDDYMRQLLKTISEKVTLDDVDVKICKFYNETSTESISRKAIKLTSRGY